MPTVTGLVGFILLAVGLAHMMALTVYGRKITNPTQLVLVFGLGTLIFAGAGVLLFISIIVEPSRS